MRTMVLACSALVIGWGIAGCAPPRQFVPSEAPPAGDGSLSTSQSGTPTPDVVAEVLTASAPTLLAMTQNPVATSQVITVPPDAPQTQPTAPPASPAATATTAPAGPPPAPSVLSYTIDNTEFKQGGAVTLTWETQGAIEVEIVIDIYTFDRKLYSTANHPVPASGHFTYEMPDVQINQASFLLRAFATPDHGVFFNSAVFAHTPCPNPYFFTFPAVWKGTELDVCPDGAALSVPAVQQEFERGQMDWMPFTTPDVSAPANGIAALAGVGSAAEPLGGCFDQDTWTTAEIESDPAIVPPPGYYQPVRGFGKIWRDHARDYLGWARAPEHSYTAQYQFADVVWSPYRDYFGYMSTADNQVVLLHCVRLNKYWRYVP